MEVEQRPRRGIIFILSAPSGAGKTTIFKVALKEIEGLEASISLTTRPPREGETDGLDYHFVSEEEFKQREAAGAFAELARVFDSCYGTPRAPLDRAITSERDILLDIDVQGATQIRAAYPRDSVTIFVLPPSFAELEGRLRGRGTESPAAIAHRLRRAHEEASAYPAYDYLLINVDVAISIAQLGAIVAAERLKVTRLLEGFTPWKE
jgi:guanylate kinase